MWRACAACGFNDPLYEWLGANNRYLSEELPEPTSRVRGAVQALVRGNPSLLNQLLREAEQPRSHVRINRIANGGAVW